MNIEVMEQRANGWGYSAHNTKQGLVSVTRLFASNNRDYIYRIRANDVTREEFVSVLAEG